MYGSLMATLNELPSTKSKGTQATIQATKKLIDYFHTHSDAATRYCASQIQLYIHSNESYVSTSKARIRVGRHFFLSDKYNPTSQNKHNGAVLVVAAILKNVMASTAEAELWGLFINVKEGNVLRTSLEETGHPQGPTLMKTDNSTVWGIINETVKQHRSKSIDMRFYWVRDRRKKKHLPIYWALGK